MSVETSADPYDLIEVPSVARYVDALKALRDLGIFRANNAQKGIQLDILRTHYSAPDHAITSEELADAIGLATYRAGNLKYSALAKQLAAKLGIEPVSKASLAGKKPIWLAIFSRFSDGQPGVRPDDDPGIRLTLLPEVVAALEATFFSHLSDK